MLVTLNADHARLLNDRSIDRKKNPLQSALFLFSLFLSLLHRELATKLILFAHLMSHDFSRSHESVRDVDDDLFQCL